MPIGSAKHEVCPVLCENRQFQLVMKPVSRLELEGSLFFKDILQGKKTAGLELGDHYRDFYSRARAGAQSCFLGSMPQLKCAGQPLEFCMAVLGKRQRCSAELSQDVRAANLRIQNADSGVAIFLLFHGLCLKKQPGTHHASDSLMHSRGAEHN